jgi:hypothetical protein
MNAPISILIDFDSNRFRLHGAIAQAIASKCPLLPTGTKVAGSGKVYVG